MKNCDLGLENTARGLVRFSKSEIALAEAARAISAF